MRAAPPRPPPRGTTITPLARLTAGYTNVAILALVADVAAPKPTSTGEFSCALRLRDATCSPDTVVTVNVFRRDQRLAPAHALVPGAIVFLRPITTQSFQGRIQGIIKTLDRAHMAVLDSEPGASLEVRAPPGWPDTAAVFNPLDHLALIAQLRELWHLVTHPLTASQLESPGAANWSPLVSAPARGGGAGAAAPAPPSTPTPAGPAAVTETPFKTPALGQRSPPRSTATDTTVATPRAIHPGTPTPTRDPVTRLADVVAGQFVTVAGHLLAMRRHPTRPAMLAAIADYSLPDSDLLLDLAPTITESALTGPPIPGALQILFWDEAAHAAESLLAPPCVVRIRNVRVKRDPNGYGIELMVHGERNAKFPSRDRIMVLDRASALWNTIEGRRQELIARKEAVTEAEQEEDVGEPPAKRARRSRAKRPRDRVDIDALPTVGVDALLDEENGATPAAGNEPRHKPVTRSPASSGRMSIPLGQDKVEEVPSPTQTPHVYVPTTPLATILADTTVPFKYRCRVRFTHVVPDRVTNLTRAHCAVCRRSFTDAQCPMCRTAPAEYIWRFALLAVDGSSPAADGGEAETEAARVPVLVSDGRGADFMAGVAPPVDLTRNPATARSVLAALVRLLAGRDLDAAVRAGLIAEDLVDAAARGEVLVVDVLNAIQEGSAEPVTPPWCDVCVQSYRVHEDAARPRYQFFDTVLRQ
ncbi:hypothetical protein GGF32_003044 [Allomyces javanicus]|nr:hypothetical protein GGF32_003044 [Allomyces javanicus]